ncbi:MAG: hypothetical protein QNK89_04355 [Lacinutrix sp.]|uniref:hypothetical protein n=1 Tax=Lacinutrix sp. TaxID=1937692 RepID=UPI0030A5FC4F
MDNKVFAILKKITKEQKTELSAVSDLQDWLDLNEVDQVAFRITDDLAGASYELSNSIAAFENEIAKFETKYLDTQNFQEEDFKNRYIDGENALITYERLADELGVDVTQNEVYNQVKAQVGEIYPDFIDRLENAYIDAEAVIDELENINLDYITRN